MSQKKSKANRVDETKTVKKPLINPKYKSYVYTGVFLAVVLLLFVLNNTNGEPDNGPYPPKYKEASANTEMLKLSDLKGKVVILDFWATWCPPCRKGIPDLIELKNEYGKKGLEIVGISIDEISRNTQDQVLPFIKEFGINYPVVYGDFNITSAFGGINSIPTSYIIDKEGKVVSRYVGLYPKSTYVADIEKILGDSYSNEGKVDAPDFSLPIAK